MPLYEFHCNSCRKDAEILVRSPDWTGTKCPHCGSTRLAKKLSVFAASSGGGGNGGEGECAYPGACAMPSSKAKGRGKSHGGGCPCCH